MPTCDGYGRLDTVRPMVDERAQAVVRWVTIGGAPSIESR